jgi:YceI-like protein
LVTLLLIVILWSLQGAHLCCPGLGLAQRLRDRVVRAPPQTRILAGLTAPRCACRTSSAKDEHLRSEEFLDVQRFPKIRYRNTSAVPAHDDHWRVDGDLTIRGVTRPVSLNVEFCGVATDPWGNTRAGFLGTTEINRDDFDITWNQALETGGFVLGKGVKVEIDVEAVRSANE